MEGQTQLKLIDVRYKDANPLDTVKYIKNLLKQYNITTNETWYESNVPHCYTVRISMNNTTFGANGKGLTREFALASGYGELMERFQLGFIGDSNTMKSEEVTTHCNSVVEIDASALLTNRHWFEKLSQQYYEFFNESITPEQIVQQYADSDNKVLSLPLYSITQNRKVYFPQEMQKKLYGSNGCAAGNSMEEAIVQAISEIVERHHTLKILSSNTSLPVIPDEVLQQFETVSSILSYLRGSGLRIIVKDCSLGKAFPVVCICFIDPKTGKYHSHFGANPVLEIALERALTETFQGRTRENFANIDDFVYQTDEFTTPKYLINQLVYGVSKKQPTFFIEQEGLCWNESMGFSGSNNQQLLQEMVDYFSKDGYEILVQDGSCLGFPTCRVLIPGYSEALIYRLNEQNHELIYKEYAKRFLRNPSACDLDDYFGTVLHFQAINEVIPKHNKKASFASNADLSIALPKEKNIFMLEASLGFIYYALGHYPQAVQSLSQMQNYSEQEQQESIICLKRYLNLLMRNYPLDQIMQILNCFHQKETVTNLELCLKQNRNPFEMYTLHCDKSCKKDCPVYQYCTQTHTEQLRELIDSQTKKMDFNIFANRMSALLK